MIFDWLRNRGSFACRSHCCPICQRGYIADSMQCAEFQEHACHSVSWNERCAIRVMVMCVVEEWRSVVIVPINSIRVVRFGRALRKQWDAKFATHKTNSFTWSKWSVLPVFGDGIRCSKFWFLSEYCWMDARFVSLSAVNIGSEDRKAYDSVMYAKIVFVIWFLLWCGL